MAQETGLGPSVPFDANLVLSGRALVISDRLRQLQRLRSVQRHSPSSCAQRPKPSPLKISFSSRRTARREPRLSFLTLRSKRFLNCRPSLILCP